MMIFLKSIQWNNGQESVYVLIYWYEWKWIKKLTEVYAFYHDLSKLEESKGYELYDQVRDDILRFLIEKHTKIDLNEITQILFLLQDVSSDALSSNNSNWYENLIKC
jgi:hypothetical protein